MELFKILLLSIVEGISEWLPISSTGHMLLVEQVLPLHLRAEFKEIFFVVIQFFAILSVLFYFWDKLLPFRLQKLSFITDMDTIQLWKKVLLATLPAAVFGFLFDDFLESYLHTPLIIALTLILYGVGFIAVEKYNKDKTLPIKTMDALTYKHALIIGFFQVLALIPGTSRSGATILGALLIGVSRPVGAEFTFFLAIPVMLGASLLKLFKFFLNGYTFLLYELFYLFLGGIVAFLVSLFAVKFLMNFVKKHDFTIFGWYRIGLGTLVIAYLVIPSLL